MHPHQRTFQQNQTRLTGNCARQQCLTSTRRANKQCALGDLASKARKFLRVAQEFHNLFELFLGFVDACNIVKRHAPMLFSEHLGLGFTKAHGTTFAAALHPVHEINPDTDQQKEGQQRHKERLEARLLLLFCAHGNAVFDQQARDFGIFRLDGHKVFGSATEQNLFAIQRNVADRSVLNRVHKL
jgi:hypothetical protein